MDAQAEIVVEEQDVNLRGVHSRVTTRVIRTLTEIEEIRPAWEKWSHHPNSDIEFFLMNLRNEPGDPQPNILVVYRDSQPECMLVGRVTRRRVEFKIGYKTLCKPEARVIGFVYAGLLGHTNVESSRLLFEEVFAGLNRDEADAAFFMLLKMDSPLLKLLRSAPPWNIRDHFISSQAHRGMSVPSDAEQFRANLSPKVRKNQKWQAKRFLSEYAGNVEIRCIQDISGLSSAIKSVECIAAKTYQRALGVGFIDNATMRERLVFEAAQGWLRIYLLYAAGIPCAFWIGTAYKGTFHSGYMGFDPAFARHSPGMFLITRVLEGFCGSSHEIREVDFGHGDAQYKAVLGTRAWEEAPIYLFAPNIRGRYLAVLRALTALIDRASRRLLVETGLLERAKKMWREQRRKTSPSAKPTGD